MFKYINAAAMGVGKAAVILVSVAFYPLLVVAALIDKATGRGPGGKGRA